MLTLMLGLAAVYSATRASKVVAVIPETAVMHDHWLALAAAAFGRIGFLDRPTLYYRQHGNNVFGASQYSVSSFWRRLRQGRRKIRERFDIPAEAPWSGSCFDLLRGEWIRLAPPVEKKKAAAEKKLRSSDHQDYRRLMEAAGALLRAKLGHAVVGTAPLVCLDRAQVFPLGKNRGRNSGNHDFLQWGGAAYCIHALARLQDFVKKLVS